MNKENLHKLIDKYEENFYFINDSIHDEIFKWKAAKQFRDVWFSEEAKGMLFSEMFNEAKKDFSILMDNSYVCPSSGVVKIAEKDQKSVADLFNNVLFSDDGGDLNKRQNNLDSFREQFDKLRSIYFPQSFKFKQDRHAASCYLFFFNPSTNYIYRYTEAETFAQFIEFGKDIGSGDEFRLENYYEMCDLIVEALKEHVSLLEKHFALLTNDYYRDESLHLLAFDVIYCSRAYNLFDGLSHKTKKESIKAYTLEQAREKERYEREARIATIKKEIFELENKIEQYSEISLVNVEVYHSKYGKGIIVSQDKNLVDIKFESCTKSFEIHKKFIGRPTFEDDENIVEAMSQYKDILDRIEELSMQLEMVYNS